MIDPERARRLAEKESAIARITEMLHGIWVEGQTLLTRMRRPETTWDDVIAIYPELASVPASRDAIAQVMLETKYAGFIERQADQIDRFRRLEGRPIPPHFDYLAIPQLRIEAREKLTQVRPTNLGQAGRISGITPGDLAVLLFYLGGSVMGKGDSGDDPLSSTETPVIAADGEDLARNAKEPDWASR
jgi:tRNA uridine 5-carboxymethylaminomethyl modification enzyme